LSAQSVRADAQRGIHPEPVAGQSRFLDDGAGGWSVSGFPRHRSGRGKEKGDLGTSRGKGRLSVAVRLETSVSKVARFTGDTTSWAACCPGRQPSGSRRGRLRASPPRVGAVGADGGGRGRIR
jgi:hypothetical protein